MKNIHKILITLGLVLLCFAGCESDLTGVKETSDSIPVKTAVIYHNDSIIETIEFTDMEYSMILDNGHGFAFSKNGVFVKSYLTENIQTIIIK